MTTATAQPVAILVWAAGIDAPERVATPFFFAQAAAALDVEVEMYFTGPAVALLTAPAQSVLVGFGNERRALSDYLRDTATAGVRLYACSQALAGLGLARDVLVAECTGIGGAVQFMGRVTGDGWRALSF